MEKVNPDVKAESGWELRSDDVSHDYFFGTHESSILNEFGWNIPSESSGGFPDFHQIETDLSPSRIDDISIEPMVLVKLKVDDKDLPSPTTGSSEDQPENSTASGAADTA